MLYDSRDADSQGSDDEFEEISSDEVDRVIEALETLMATVESENIRFHLDEASEKIYSLVYDEENPGREEAA